MSCSSTVLFSAFSKPCLQGDLDLAVTRPGYVVMQQDLSLNATRRQTQREPYLAKVVASSQCSSMASTFSAEWAAISARVPHMPR